MEKPSFSRRALATIGEVESIAARIGASPDSELGRKLAILREAAAAE